MGSWLNLKAKFLKWNRQRRFIKAYRILRNESERHTKAGHHVQFNAVNQSLILLVCYDCPDYAPMRYPIIVRPE
jgi:hypothetical protein